MAGLDVNRVSSSLLFFGFVVVQLGVPCHMPVKSESVPLCAQETYVT